MDLIVFSIGCWVYFSFFSRSCFLFKGVGVMLENGKERVYFWFREILRIGC